MRANDGICELTGRQSFRRKECRKCWQLCEQLLLYSIRVCVHKQNQTFDEMRSLKFEIEKGHYLHAWQSCPNSVSGRRAIRYRTA